MAEVNLLRARKKVLGNHIRYISISHLVSDLTLMCVQYFWRRSEFTATTKGASEKGETTNQLCTPKAR